MCVRVFIFRSWNWKSLKLNCTPTHTYIHDKYYYYGITVLLRSHIFFLTNCIALVVLHVFMSEHFRTRLRQAPLTKSPFHHYKAVNIATIPKSGSYFAAYLVPRAYKITRSSRCASRSPIAPAVLAKAPYHHHSPSSRRDPLFQPSSGRTLFLFASFAAERRARKKLPTTLSGFFFIFLSAFFSASRAPTAALAPFLFCHQKI